MKNIFLLFITLFSLQLEAQNEKLERNFEKFKQYYSLLYSHYLDTVDFDKIIESAIVKSLENLDPHSSYFPPKDASDENERLRGNFEGIGISYNVVKDTLNVLDVISGGPSEKIGLQIGDKLIKINDTVFAGKNMRNDDYVKRLKGKKGTIVKVSMLRFNKLIDFTITRDVIPIYSVDLATMIDDKIGYIKLNKFAGTTEEEIKKALTELISKGMKTLILDLQYNGGGFLNAAVSLCDQFLDKDQLVVYTQGLHYPKQTFTTSGNGLFTKGKLIVLVNENSASASEITSGAIQDWDRGLIIGRRTFGKGLVQRPFQLVDNSQLRLTTAEYFTPSGRFIQKPYNKGDLKEYRADLLHRFQSGQLTKQDTIKVPDSLMKFTSNKRKVYGGGGILPDIYVPIDTSINTDFYFSIFRKGILNNYTSEYASNNKVKLLDSMPNFELFDAKFKIDGQILKGLFDLAAKDSISYNDSSYKKSEILFRTMLKANIARNTYGNAAFYKSIMAMDPMIQKAILISRENFSKYKVRNE